MKTKAFRFLALILVIFATCTVIIGCDMKCGGPPLEIGGGEYVTDAEHSHSGTVEGGNYPDSELGEPVRWFVAEVIKALDGQLLVKAHEDSWESYDQIYVTTTLHSGEKLTGFAAGDVIRITYDGTMAESYPPQIFTVYNIEHFRIEQHGTETHTETETNTETETTDVLEVYGGVYVTDAKYKHSGTVVGGNYPGSELGEPVRWFVAEVLENYGEYLFVEGHEDSCEWGNQIYVWLESRKSLSGFKKGDVVRITFDGMFAESEPEQAWAYSIERYTTDVPDDFEFSLTWGVYGISSYDSQTGKLVKTTDATDPEDYVTNYTLTDKEMAFVYGLISALDVYSYPEVYDPGNGMSEPSATLILTVRVDDEEKTIKAEDISLFYKSEDAKGQLFLDTCSSISNLLTETEAWKALPDYETLYE